MNTTKRLQHAKPILQLNLTLLHSNFPTFTWQKVVVCSFDQKQFLRVSYIALCLSAKYSVTIYPIFVSLLHSLFNFQRSIYLFITFCFPHMVEKVLFFGQIFEMEILMSFHCLSSLNPKISLLEVGLCVCVLLV